MDVLFQLSGVSSENLQLKACLSYGKRLIPTLSAHFDPYSGYPLPPPISVPGSTQKEREENREEMSLCPGGRLFSLNVTAANVAKRVNTFQRVMVPYPAAGQWFLTLLPSCSKINIRRGNQET